MRIVALVVAGTLSAFTAAGTSPDSPRASTLHGIDLFDALTGSATQAVDLCPTTPRRRARSPDVCAWT